MLAEEKETPFLVNAAEWTAWASRMIEKQHQTTHKYTNCDQDGRGVKLVSIYGTKFIPLPS